MLIETKRLIMRPVEPEDATFLAKLMDEIDLHKPSAPICDVRPTSKEIEQKWISQAGSATNEANLIIEMRAGKQQIGIISVTDIEKRNASAFIGIRLKEDMWDKGYGAEAVRGVAEFMFDTLNIHRVWMKADEENDRAIRCFESCGFTLEGVLRDTHIRSGVWKNSVEMSLLPGELKEERK